MLNFPNADCFSIISDRDTGVTAGVNANFKGRNHYICVKHLLGNLKTKTYKDIEGIFWLFAKTYSLNEFNILMNYLKITR